MATVLPYDRRVLWDKPTGYWPVDELAGTSFRNLVDPALPMTDGGSGGVGVGKFPAGGRHINAPTAASSKPNIVDSSIFSATSISLEFWFQWAGTTDDLLLVKGRHVSVFRFEWQFYIATNTVGFSVLQSGGGTYSSATTGVIQADRLYHCVGTFHNPATRTAIYLDGREVATSTSTSGTRGPNDGADVGVGGYASGSTSSSYSGTIGHIAVYDYALSPTKIAAHNRAGRAAHARLPRVAA